MFEFIVMVTVVGSYTWVLSHTTLPCTDGWMNCGLMKEKPANSLWSMLAMTSWSGGVSMGWVRVKNLSKFSAPLPHCNKRGNGFHRKINAVQVSTLPRYIFFSHILHFLFHLIWKKTKNWILAPPPGGFDSWTFSYVSLIEVSSDMGFNLTHIITYSPVLG